MGLKYTPFSKQLIINNLNFTTMKTLLIILAIIYVAVGLYFWVRNLIIVQIKEKELPEDEKYNMAAKVSGSILLLFMWVIAWPIVLWKVTK